MASFEEAQEKIDKQKMDNAIATIVRGVNTATILAMKHNDTISVVLLEAAAAIFLSHTIGHIRRFGWPSSETDAALKETNKLLGQAADRYKEKFGDGGGTFGSA